MDAGASSFPFLIPRWNFRGWVIYKEYTFIHRTVLQAAKAETGKYQRESGNVYPGEKLSHSSLGHCLPGV